MHLIHARLTENVLLHACTVQVMCTMVTALLANKEYDLFKFKAEADLDIGPSFDQCVPALEVDLMVAFESYSPTDSDWESFGEHAYPPILQHFADVTQAWLASDGCMPNPQWRGNLLWSLKYLKVIGKLNPQQ